MREVRGTLFPDERNEVRSYLVTAKIVMLARGRAGNASMGQSTSSCQGRVLLGTLLDSHLSGRTKDSHVDSGSRGLGALCLHELKNCRTALRNKVI